MTRVDRMSELLAALRQQMSSRTDGKRAERSASSATDVNEASVRRVESLKDLQQRLGRELKRYNLKSKAELKQARQSFFESVITWDMGEQLSLDPRFSLMIREVEETIASDAHTSSQLDLLIATLQLGGA